MKALFLQILSLCLSASIVALLVMGLRLLLKKAPRLQVVTCEVIPIRTMSSIRDICVSLEKLGEIE